MKRLVKLTAVLLVLAALLSAGAALAQGPQPPPPLTPEMSPQWARAPGSPQVAYAPNIPADLFRHGRQFYYYSGGSWYRSKSRYGPWRPARRLPRGILRLPRSAFKTAPPW
jgi:hypothetical protein